MVLLTALTLHRRVRYNGRMLMVIYNLIKAMFSSPRGYFHMWITISNAGAFFVFNRRAIDDNF